jgi:hypothetical protein
VWRESVHENDDLYWDAGVCLQGWVAQLWNCPQIAQLSSPSVHWTCLSSLPLTSVLHIKIYVAHC